MMTSGRQRLPETIAARKAVIKLVTKQMAKLVITIVIKRLTNRVSQDVAVEGDVEAVAVVGGVIAAQEKKFGLTITKNCRAMVGTLMGSEPKGRVQLLRPLQIRAPKIAGKMTWVKGWMLIPKKELLNQMQVLVLAAVERMIRRNREQVIVHHAVAVVAVVVDGEHEMAKM